MKLLFLVIDGMGDLPIEEFEGKTPLEFASTPNMDYLAENGKLGMMYTIGKGVAPESDVAVISILGYDPYKYYTGRGPIEAVGADIDMKDGNLALRCNFATLDKKNRILDRRAGRDLTGEETRKLSKDINKKVRFGSYPADFEFKSTISYRGVLVIKSRNKPLSSKITITDPAYEMINGISIAKKEFKMVMDVSKPTDASEEAKISAALVNEFTDKSHKVLENHEVNKNRISEGKFAANCILSRSPSNKLPNLFNINKKYNVHFACLIDMPVERGISKLAGMSLIPLPPPTKNLQEDSVIRVRKLIEMAQYYDCFYIHIKGPDIPGHDGNPVLKKELIEIIDKYFLENFLQKVDIKDWLICITADHSTPCKLKRHSDDPVPILISGKGIEGEKSRKFGEKACKKGSLGIFKKGSELMPILMDYLKRNQK